MTVTVRYPIYVPSKGRHAVCYTAEALVKDGIPFYLVVEEPEADRYAERFGRDRLLILPFVNQGVVAARNWIKAHSIKELGAERHWQLDDNIQGFWRRWKTKKIRCDAEIALGAAETFTDRYENIALTGLNYYMFAPDKTKQPPFWLNTRIYSCTLVNNAIPYSWRGRYNEDADLCLQVLSEGWCTVLLNAFLCWKTTTMQLSGGNTDDLYRGDGRLRMAKALERRWPGVVTTNRRFQRPQHIVKGSWRPFDTPLKLKPGIDLAALPPVDEMGQKLVKVRDPRNDILTAEVEEHWLTHGGARE